MKINEVKSLDGRYQYTVGEQGVVQITFDERETYLMIYKGAYGLDLHRKVIVVPASAFMAVYDYDQDDEEVW
ncbi:hypothetical protein [Weissella soli]|uniref:hypothetical protein n=1 Tax=Weissella soli TaxID=155866 RepID=UPI003EF10393